MSNLSPALLIGERRIESNERPGGVERYDPATGAALGAGPRATREDVDAAAVAVSRAAASWRDTPPVRRERILRAAAAALRDDVEAVAAAITREQGKLLREAREEVATAADLLEWFGAEGRRAYGRNTPLGPGLRATTEREPVGPVLAVTPWNFPLQIAARKVAAALAAGCTIVLKPSDEAPAGAMALHGALSTAGLPPGAFNVLLGSGPEITGRLISGSAIRKVSFTGSTEVGRHIGALAGERLKPATLELGGHAPVLVLDDADLDVAVALCAAAKVRNAGQVCTAPSRFIVLDRVYDRFVGGLSDALRSVRVGPGDDAASDMGPLANARRKAAIQALIGDVVSRGGRAQVGPAPDDGFHQAPVVLTDAPPDARVWTEEPFGPVAPVLRVSAIEDAVRAANATPYALAAYVFTDSARHAREAPRALRAGMVGVNTFAVSRPETPFGGDLDSGFGREAAVEGLDAYLTVKSVVEA